MSWINHRKGDIMNCNKIIIISLILLFLSVTAVSAADFNNVTELSSDVDDSIIVKDSFLESSEIQDLQLSSNSTGTFTDLQALVNNASAGSVLELTMDYNGDDLTAFYGNTSQYNITFKDKNGKNLQSGVLIRYQFDDSGFKNAFTQDDGIVSFDISSLTPGEHNLTVINLLNKENKTYTLEIIGPVSGISNKGKNNQTNPVTSQEPVGEVSRENQQGNSASSTNDLSYYRGIVEFLPPNVVNQLNTAGGSADNNQSNNNAPVKSITQEKTVLNNNNLYWILLLILLVVLGLFLIRKMRK